MSDEGHRRPVWRSPFKVGLAVISGAAYATACMFEQRLPGDSEWLYCYTIIFAGSVIAAVVEPEHFLETAAMPFFAILLLGFSGFGGPLFLVTMIFALGASVPGAFLGAVGRRIGKRIDLFSNVSSQ